MKNFPTFATFHSSNNQISSDLQLLFLQLWGSASRNFNSSDSLSTKCLNIRTLPTRFLFLQFFTFALLLLLLLLQGAAETLPYTFWDSSQRTLLVVKQVIHTRNWKKDEIQDCNLVDRRLLLASLLADKQEKTTNFSEYVTCYTAPKTNSIKTSKTIKYKLLYASKIIDQTEIDQGRSAKSSSKWCIL